MISDHKEINKTHPPQDESTQLLKLIQKLEHWTIENIDPIHNKLAKTLDAINRLRKSFDAPSIADIKQFEAFVESLNTVPLPLSEKKSILFHFCHTIETDPAKSIGTLLQTVFSQYYNRPFGDHILSTMSISPEQTIDDLRNISKSFYNNPILINRNGQISLYGFSQKTWKETNLNSEVFKKIVFPETNYLCQLEKKDITQEMVQEISSKQAHTLTKEVPVFIIYHHDETMKKLISKLLSAGLNDWANFIGLDAHSGCNICYLKTEGTLLHATLDYEPLGEKYTYKLFYNDIEISELSFNNVDLHDKNTHYSIKNLDLLPKNLAKKKQLEEKNPDILLPIGHHKPDWRDMLHLNFLGITANHISFDEKQNQFFIKLPKNQGFSYLKKYNSASLLSSYPQITYHLQYHGIQFAKIIEFYYSPAKETILFVEPDWIVDARKSPENIICIPSSEYTDWEQGNKIKAKGTVESCLFGISKNQYATFTLDFPSGCYSMLEEEFYQTLFNSEQAQLLMNALKKNSTLEELHLPKIHLTKDDFLELVETVKKIKAFKHLSLEKARIDVTPDEFSKATVGLSVDSSNVKFLPQAKKEHEHKRTKGETQKIGSLGVFPPKSECHVNKKTDSSILTTNLKRL